MTYKVQCYGFKTKQSYNVPTKLLYFTCGYYACSSSWKMIFMCFTLPTTRVVTCLSLADVIGGHHMTAVMGYKIYFLLSFSSSYSTSRNALEFSGYRENHTADILSLHQVLSSFLFDSFLFFFFLFFFFKILVRITIFVAP